MSIKPMFLFTFISVVEQALGRPIFNIANVNRAASGNNSSLGNFGSCSVPQIQFGTGFDNRKETSFEPVDQKSYTHGSAQNIDVITQFMCDALVNTCGADQRAKNTCAEAKTAADTTTAKTGAQADAFNSVFNINTNFAAVAAVDDQGNVISSTGPNAASSPASSYSSTTVASSTLTSTSASGSPSIVSSSGPGLGNFGSCSVPQIEFGTGFDGRKETSFRPVDKASFNHGSAQAIDIISQFICDTLTNSCGADQTAKNTCANAKAAADAQPPKTGAQADAFNAAFGNQTNFATVAEVDDQGNVIAGSAASSGISGASKTASSTAPTSLSCVSDVALGGAAYPYEVACSADLDHTKRHSFQRNTYLDIHWHAGRHHAVTRTGNGEFQLDDNSNFKD